jgi:hypothetical protein
MSDCSQFSKCCKTKQAFTGLVLQPRGARLREAHSSPFTIFPPWGARPENWSHNLKRYASRARMANREQLPPKRGQAGQPPGGAGVACFTASCCSQLSEIKIRAKERLAQLAVRHAAPSRQWGKGRGQGIRKHAPAPGAARRAPGWRSARPRGLR